MARPDESMVRRLVETQLGTPLVKRKVMVGEKNTGEKVYCQFDGVSPDAGIIVEIKTNELFVSENKPRGRYDSAIKQALITDLYRLSRVEAEAKYLVLTDRPLYDLFVQDMDGFLPSDVKVLYCCADSTAASGS